MSRFSSNAADSPTVPCTDLLNGIPTPAHAAEVKEIVSLRFSSSSKSSISAALGHWRGVCDKYMWPEEIVTGDLSRGAKLVCFVLALMAYEKEPGVFYPASTISNYVWALCAHMQAMLYADPRVNVVGWRFFMAAVTVLCFVPYEPRRRVPTESIRAALARPDDLEDEAERGRGLTVSRSVVRYALTNFLSYD